MTPIKQSCKHRDLSKVTLPTLSLYHARLEEHVSSGCGWQKY